MIVHLISKIKRNCAMAVTCAGLAQLALRCLLSLLSLILLSSCASTPGGIVTTPIVSTPIASAPNILLVNTNNTVERYQVAQQAFLDTVRNVNVHQLDLAGENSPTEVLQDSFNTHQFDAVYCIGAKALGSVDYLDRDLPVVYSSVLNWRRFAGESNYFGVASEVAPEAQLTWFKYFFPEIRKIGVIYSADNRKLIKDAAVSAENLSLQLVAEEIDSPDRLLDTLARMGTKVDALWLISDPVVVSSSESTQSLFDYANQQNLPVFAYSSFYIELGAVFSISADLPTTGRQAALMMQNLLTRGEPQASVQHPAGTVISLNMGKVRAYQLKLNDAAFDSVNEIVESPVDRGISPR